MSMEFNCRGVAEHYLDWVSNELPKLAKKPTIATVYYSGSKNPASLQYRNLIIKDASRFNLKAISADVHTESELIARLHDLNNDSSVTGIVVLYPLNASISDEDVMDVVSEAKDIEGLHSTNLGYLIKYKRFLDQDQKVKCVVPATPKAIVKTLQTYPDIPIRGAFVTIVNNSMRVGKPLGLMLENLGATVIKCYDKTPEAVIEHSVRNSDIVVTAVPNQKFQLPADWIKPGAAIMDVSFLGNFQVDEIKRKAAYYTSPENRIGQVTRAMMMLNLVYCAWREVYFKGVDAE